MWFLIKAVVIFEGFYLLHIGYYTCVEVIFTLRRQVGFYMMGVYAPTLLIVVLSWLSFWINPDASAARVPLGKFISPSPTYSTDIYKDINAVNSYSALLAATFAVQKVSEWKKTFLQVIIIVKKEKIPGI